MRWAGLEAWLIPYADGAVRMAQAYGIKPTITSIRRNWAEQSKLYDEYISGLRTIPANPPGTSGHQYGVAFDSSVPPDQLQLWNAIRAHWGWKLYANDPVHAELPGWQNYTRFLKLT